MSSDPSASARTESGAGDTPSWASRLKPSRTALKCGLLVVTLVSLYASAFIEFSIPELSDPLLGIFVLCLLSMFLLALRALFRRRWKEFSILLAAGVVASLPYFGMTEPLLWVHVQGFRFHAWPVEEYLSRCKLIEFVENGIKQTVGQCEGHSHGYGEFVHVVIYDTTGELLRPVSHRTQAWQKAMSEFYSDEVLNSSEGRTQHIFGDFYNVGTNIAEERGG